MMLGVSAGKFEDHARPSNTKSIKSFLCARKQTACGSAATTTAKSSATQSASPARPGPLASMFAKMTEDGSPRTKENRSIASTEETNSKANTRMEQAELGKHHMLQKGKDARKDTFGQKGFFARKVTTDRIAHGIEAPGEDSNDSDFQLEGRVAFRAFDSNGGKVHSSGTIEDEVLRHGQGSSSRQIQNMDDQNLLEPHCESSSCGRGNRNVSNSSDCGSNLLCDQTIFKTASTGNEDMMRCDKCGKDILVWEFPEHADFHVALEIQHQQTLEAQTSRVKQNALGRSTDNGSNKRKNSQKGKVGRPAKRLHGDNDMPTLDYFGMASAKRTPR